jgi:selenocysteine-specific elongation factor
MYVIGTAGHVDHGKSTLVKALTDIDPDRLPEEKEREMTVDLGFAWMTLPSGREVSIVDVPGHERFIKNMLAGVGGIDLALLIVAADESVMPQTREHLAILDILRVTRGLVVVTKTDLVDEELVELVQAEVEDTLAGTSFQGCPMVGVSAYTGDGMNELRGMIDSILDDTEARRDLGRPRLPIDRCFTISGFGTVVTGTLIDGSLAVGQEIELAGSQQRARIRGLQSHKARRVDARLRMVNDAPHSLKHNEGVTFHLFTSESPARARLLDAEQLSAGAEGWVQLLLSEPLPVVKGDYFVVRSADSTLGGGQVVDPNPRRRHRRFDADVSERLMLLDEGASEDVIVSVAEQWGPCGLAELSRRANLPREESLERATELAKEGGLVALGDLATDSDAVVYSALGWGTLKGRLATVLRSYHDQYPLRKGAPAQEVRSRLGLSQPVYLRALARLTIEGFVAEDGQAVRLPGHEVTFTPRMEQQVARFLESLEREPYSPPTDNQPDAEVLGALVEQGRVVRMGDSVVFTADAYREMTGRIVEHLRENGSITVAEARTLFNTSRKYILPLLERMDQEQITRRNGDERVLR